MTVEKILEEYTKIAELHYFDYKIIINDKVWVRDHSLLKCIDILRESEPYILTEDIEDLNIDINTANRLVRCSITTLDCLESLPNMTEEQLLIIFERAILSGDKDTLLQKIFEFNRQPGKQAWYFEKNRIPYLQIGETTYSLYLRETVKK